MKKVLGAVLVAVTLVAVFPTSASGADVPKSGCGGTLMAPCRNPRTLPPISNGGGGGTGTSSGHARRPLPPIGRR